ncbi:MAG: hypothetical protein IT222_03870 [Crocinitomix sp.]|nr:hypothetical protein [Crocinitomix sp.]
MNKNELAQRIEDFWEWFDENREVIQQVVSESQHPETNYIVEQLDQHLLGMGKLKWQLENPHESKFNLVLSPNNDRKLLEITRAIIQKANRHQDWEYHHAIPLKETFEVILYDNEMEIRTIIAHHWNVIPLIEADGRCELLIEAPELLDLDEDTQLIAVDLMLTDVLGEELKIKHLSGFQILEFVEDDQVEELLPLQQLRQILTR